MALDGVRSALSGLSELRKEKTEEKENLWRKILTEVQTNERTKLPSCKSVLVLGDNESGKTTLIAKLQGNEDPKKGSGLEYAYIDVRDEYREDHTRLSVWILDGNPSHSELLKFAINEQSLEHTLVLLTVSMTTPWSLMDQLQTWAMALQDHVDRLSIDPDKYKERQRTMQRLWHDYTEPGDELEASAKRSSRNLEEEEQLILPEKVLTRNLGLHVIVVVTKTDYMSTLEKDLDYKEEHFDFIQQSIRKFCLQYGAALFYTSVKEDKNCDLLYKYLVHRVFNFPFRTPALVVEKDAVFIPSGWDNEKKIAILYENLHSMNPDDFYQDVIVKPMAVRKAVTREVEIQAEEEQSFLSRHQVQLQAGAPGSQQPLTPGVAGAGVQSTPQVGARQAAQQAVQKTGDRRPSAGSGSPASLPNQMLNTPKKMDPAKAGLGTANEGVLANFFNSLLSKKTGSTTPPGTIKLNADKTPGRSDVTAELDRLTRVKTTSNSSSDTNNSISDC